MVWILLHSHHSSLSSSATQPAETLFPPTTRHTQLTRIPAPMCTRIHNPFMSFYALTRMALRMAALLGGEGLPLVLLLLPGVDNRHVKYRCLSRTITLTSFSFFSPPPGPGGLPVVSFGGV